MQTIHLQIPTTVLQCCLYLLDRTPYTFEVQEFLSLFPRKKSAFGRSKHKWFVVSFKKSGAIFPKRTKYNKMISPNFHSYLPLAQLFLHVLAKGSPKSFSFKWCLVSPVAWTHHEFKMSIFPNKKHSCSQTNKIHDFDPENKPWKKPNPNAPCMDYLFTYIMWKMARFQGEMVGKYSLHGTFWEEKTRPFSSTISSTSLATIGGTGGR